jgi:hypothetical protein
MGVSPLSLSVPKLTKQYLDTLGSHLAIVRLPFHSPSKADEQDKKASELLTSPSPPPQSLERTHTSTRIRVRLSSPVSYPI